MKRCLTLHRLNQQIFCELGEDYFLYICEEETLAKLTACQIVLLVNATIADHLGPRSTH